MKSRSSKTVDCLGMGIVPLDLLFTVDRYPEAGKKIDGSSLCVQGGGPVPNALAGLSRLGMKTLLITVVGDDLFGRMSLEQLKTEGIDCRHVIVKKQPSMVASGWIETDSGRRTMVLNRKIFVRPPDLKLSAYPVPRLLHLDGRDLKATLKLARWGRRVGAIISFDIGSIRNDISPVLPLVDHLVVSDGYAFPFTGCRSARSAIRRLARYCRGTIVITEGTKGSVGCEDGSFTRQAAFKVNAVDTTGAGDAFHAGYIYGLLHGLDLAERLHFGAAVAACKCTRPGGRAGLPRRAEVKRFLNRKPKIYA